MNKYALLQEEVSAALKKTALDKRTALRLFQRVARALEEGKIRAAQKENGVWQVNAWVKGALLWGFQHGVLCKVRGLQYHYFDKDTLPARSFKLSDKVRLVPGGSAVRIGAYVAPGVVIMPPSYVNLGAFIDAKSMIDSHALVGSCAQIGKNVHLSAAAQIGGVLEPVGSLPVIIEDNVFVGGNAGIYEGVIVSEGAVIGSGVILNASTPVFDNTTGKYLKAVSGEALIIPPGAVVVPGSRPITHGAAPKMGLQVYCPIIIKYRDAKTARAVQIEDLLRTN